VYGLSASAETGRIGYTIVPEPLHDLQVRLRALEEVGRIRTRVCPSVTVASGSKADLFLGSRQYFLFLTSPRYAAQEVILTSADVGSRISAQPWTGDAQTIVVPLQVQANTVASVDDQGLPLVSTRRAKGTVRLQSGDTILFSGLAMELTERGRRRLAPPSSLLAGELLPSHRRRREATEVLVLVSARGRYEAREAAPQTKSM
jgi:Flp pilus assembly secretin CpaC